MRVAAASSMGQLLPGQEAVGAVAILVIHDIDARAGGMVTSSASRLILIACYKARLAIVASTAVYTCARPDICFIHHTLCLERGVCAAVASMESRSDPESICRPTHHRTF